MASLFNKFQEGVKVLAKSPTFARDVRHLQFEADINRLFLYTSYNRLGKDAAESDAEEIIDMASKASLTDQQKQVQENLHSQIQTFCSHMDHILKPENPSDRSSTSTAPATRRRSGLGFAIGKTTNLSDHTVIPETNRLSRIEVSNKLKDLMGYTLDIKKSNIPHKESGQGLFLNGEVDVGGVIAFYPGVLYTPANYRYIPGYPKIDLHNPYLITRYDGTIINAQPWGLGGESRELWDGLNVSQTLNTDRSDRADPSDRSDRVDRADRMWKMLSKPLNPRKFDTRSEILEMRNPLAFAHYANHPSKELEPNVMICPYDFPLNEKNMRSYIPNILFGKEDEANMKRFGSFWFKGWRSNNNKNLDVPVLKGLVLVSTRIICDEEIYLNYRLSNAKKRPLWYCPVDEEEDRRRWG